MSIASPSKVAPRRITVGIKKAVDSSEYSKTDIAVAVGVSYAAFGHWYYGRSYPTDRNLRRLAAVTGRTVEWILNGGKDSEHDAMCRALGQDPVDVLTDLH